MRVTLGELSRTFLRLSLLGFGGPNAHLALMLDEVVERRGWITREHFLQLLGVTNLLPGPNSSEVAIHIGYTQRGWRGALATGLSFVAPTFVLVVVLSALYFRYGALPAVEGLFWGLKPAILAVVLGAGWKLGRAAVTDALLAALAAGGVAVALFLDGWEVAAMAAGGARSAGCATGAARRHPPRSAPRTDTPAHRTGPTALPAGAHTARPGATRPGPPRRGAPPSRRPRRPSSWPRRPSWRGSSPSRWGSAPSCSAAATCWSRCSSPTR